MNLTRLVNIPTALLASLCVSLIAEGAWAQSIHWPLTSGGNGHGYEVISIQMSWPDAQAFAQSQGGYLATITSAEEQAFIEEFIIPNPPTTYDAFKLGGYQDESSATFLEPNGGWRWVTGEDWRYTNWSPGEPTDCCPVGENFLTLHRVSSGDLQYSWNDNVSLSHLPFVIEYDTNPAPSTTLDFDSAPAGPITPFEDSGYSITTELNQNPNYNNAILNVGGVNQNVVTDATPDNAFGTRMIIRRVDGGSFTVESFDAANLAASSQTATPAETSCTPGGYRMELDIQPGNTCHGYAPSSSTFQSVFVEDFVAVSELNVRIVANPSLNFAIDNIRLARTSPECAHVGALAPSTATLSPNEYHHCENWSSVALAGADLTNSVLSRVNLESAVLTGAILTNVTFEHSNLASANLTSANLTSAKLTSATYDESTIFPSGNQYDSSPSGLVGDIMPWEARMIPVPEPIRPVTALGFGILLILLAGVRRDRVRSLSTVLRGSSWGCLSSLTKPVIA